MGYFKNKRNIILIAVSICGYIFDNIVAYVFNLSLQEGWFSYIASVIILLPLIVSFLLYSRDVKEEKPLKSKVFKIVGCYFIVLLIVLLIVLFCLGFSN